MSEFRMYTDGASRGNPGPGGIGVVIYDHQGKTIKQIAQFIGQCTNNIAEYFALVYGLQEAVILGCQKISIFMDSELIVRQITGQYKVKDAILKNFYLFAKHLLSSFDSYTIEHIPREKNTEADRLSNIAIDQ